jgi:hypothetical protein
MEDHASSVLEDYRRCASACASIDYSDRGSVLANNEAADRMYELVRATEQSGPFAVRKLASLLEDPLCAPWLAIQLLECCTIEPAVREKCEALIEALSRKLLGHRMWLQEYRAARLARECAKLHPLTEQKLAEEGLEYEEET